MEEFFFNSYSGLLILIEQNEVEIVSKKLNSLIESRGIGVLKDIYLNLKPYLFSRSCSGFLKRMFSLGLDIEILDKEENSPLMLATFNGNFELVKYLVENGANIHRKDCGGTNSLYIAFQIQNNLKIAKFLLEKGADPNDEIVNFRSLGRFTLLQAILGVTYIPFHRKREKVILLLNYGADPNVIDDKGRYLIDMLSSEKEKEEFLEIVNGNYIQMKEPDCQ